MATEELYLFDGFLMIIDGSDEEALPEDRIVAQCLHDTQIFMPTDVAKPDSTQITMALYTSKSTACTGYRVGMALF